LTKHCRQSKKVNTKVGTKIGLKNVVEWFFYPQTCFHKQQLMEAKSCIYYAPNTLFNTLDHVKLTILRFKNLNSSHNTNKPQEKPSQVLE
jgi:hypothetical protein